MDFRKHAKGVNLFSAIEHQQKIAKKKIGELKLKDVIDWSMFSPVLKEVTVTIPKTGVKVQLTYEQLLMFKILIIQFYHGLSNEATEIQIGDRISFQSFLDLQMGDDIPDGNTLWDFKELIEKDDRDGSNKLFAKFNELLDEQGLIAKEGSIIDASFVEAPTQRNIRDQNKQIKEGLGPEGFEEGSAKGVQKDCDARWTKKNNEVHYGYKNHTKVDAKTKLIDTYATTSASVHDSLVF